jgi:unsaturated rhamnogalacturonyl hydrolase
MAEANYGKGYVFVIGDPWLYNEYINHLYLSEDFDNLKAAKNLVNILVGKSH